MVFRIKSPQFAKTLESYWNKEFPINTSERLVQPKNANAPISLTDFGMVILFSDSQLKNADPSISVRQLGSRIFFKLMQPLKMSISIVFNESGNKTCSNFLHS